MKADIIAFDLNGTLLDMAVLDPHFLRLFGSPGHREKWFEQLQVLWMTTIAFGTYQPFLKLAEASLRMLAAKESVDLESADSRAILDRMAELPPFPDAPHALERLREAGYRIVALTNGARDSAKSQLEFAGISGAFEEVFSADQVERYKPAIEPYLHVAERLDVKPGRILMVAAHAWDIEGAARAGLRTAFVARPRQVLNPMASRPDLDAPDLETLTRKLV